MAANAPQFIFRNTKSAHGKANNSAAIGGYGLNTGMRSNSTPSAFGKANQSAAIGRATLGGGTMAGGGDYTRSFTPSGRDAFDFWGGQPKKGRGPASLTGNAHQPQTAIQPQPAATPGMWNGMAGGPQSGGYPAIDPVWDARAHNLQVANQAAAFHEQAEMREQMKPLMRPGVSLGESARSRATAPVARAMAKASAVGPTLSVQHDLENRANQLAQQEIQNQHAYRNAQVNQQLAGIRNADVLSRDSQLTRQFEMMLQGMA